MNAGQLYMHLTRQGVRFTAEDGRLIVTDPSGIITAATLAELKQRKPEILALLSPDCEAELDAAIYGPGKWIIN